jgi:hypothetical protein
VVEGWTWRLIFQAVAPFMVEGDFWIGNLGLGIRDFFFAILVAISLACVWIFYLKVISRIFMHRMHSAKNLRCLVGILENAKCILGKMHFANSHF